MSRLAMEFQPDAVEIERRSVPGGARWTLYVVIGLIIAAVTWAYLTKVDRIVVAQGKLVPTVNPIIVQAAEPSPVREVFVRFGDIVKPGQTLAILDTTFSDADVRKFKQDLNGLDAQLARLQAEQDKLDSFVIEDPDSVDWLRQAALFEARRAAYLANLAEIDQEVARTDASIFKNNEMIEMFDRRIVMLEDEVERYEALVEKGAEAESTLLGRRDSLLEAEMRATETKLQLSELDAQKKGFGMRKDAYISDWDRQVLEEMVELQIRRTELETQLEKAERMLELAYLNVPDDLPYEQYMVTEAAERNTDSVLQQGEAVFKLIPIINDGRDLEVEVAIPGKDIGQDFDGDVIVKFNAFPYQKYGYAIGHIHRISEESMIEREQDAAATMRQQSGEGSSFRAIVRIDDWDSKLQMSEETKLYPGMSVVTEINVGERRVLDYFLYPLFRNLDSSIREP